MPVSVSEPRNQRPFGIRPYFPELDGVRALAILLVMVFHFSQEWFWFRPFIFGQTGVDLFFVLSGFLITTILLQSPQGDWEEIRKFYVRRTLRIFPLYYAFLIGSTLAGAGVSFWFWVYLQNIPWALNIKIPGPAHFWSLAVEEQFYLVWPFLVMFWPRRWLGWAMGSLILLAITLRLVLVSQHIDVYFLTVTRLDGLAAGGLMALVQQRGKLDQYRPWMYGLLAASLGSLAAQWWSSQGRGLDWVEATKATAATGLYVSFVGLVLTSSGTWLHFVLRSAPLKAIGRVSYGIYVFHPAVFHLLPPRLGATPLLLKAVLSFGAAYLISVASWYGFERWFTNLKTRLAPEKRFAPVSA